jgi:hypothetical protein
MMMKKKKNKIKASFLQYFVVVVAVHHHSCSQSFSQQVSQSLIEGKNKLLTANFFFLQILRKIPKHGEKN